MSNSSIISVTNLAKVYEDGHREVKVLKDLNLVIASGEMVAIIGQSGSGKSTLLHLIGALDTPTEGQVIVKGQNIHQLTAAKQGIFRNQHLGFVYQFHHLLPEFTALENVAMPLLIRGDDTTSASSQAEQLLKAVGLADRSEHKPGELSGGEKQRVALARALVTQPDCLLADEPTGNLDAVTAQKMLQLMMDLNQSLGTSFVIVTHDHGLAEQMGRTLLLESGKIHPT
jgi:lipoprotein-releasing system ATP-binding protein